MKEETCYLCEPGACTTHLCEGHAKRLIPVLGSVSELVMECSKCGETDKQRVVIHETSKLKCEDCIVGVDYLCALVIRENSVETHDYRDMEHDDKYQHGTSFTYCPECGRKL